MRPLVFFLILFLYIPAGAYYERGPSPRELARAHSQRLAITSSVAAIILLVFAGASRRQSRAFQDGLTKEREGSKTRRVTVFIMFLAGLAVPLTFGVATPLSLVVLFLCGVMLLLTTQKPDARVFLRLSMFSALIAFVGCSAIEDSSRGYLIAMFLFSAFSFLSHLEGARRLTGGLDSRPARHLRIVQILFLIGCLALGILTFVQHGSLAEWMMVLGYLMIIFCGVFFAMGTFAWSRQLKVLSVDPVEAEAPKL